MTGTVRSALTGLGIPNIEAMAQISGYDTRYTFTDSTGRPWDRAKSKMIFAMCSTVGLLSTRKTGSPRS